jgi:DNA-binding NarL/FixJ family response regulator
MQMANMARPQNLKAEDLSKRLDLIAATLLAVSGLTRKEIAQVLNVSEKTIERMFSGNLNKIRSIRDAKSK